jgi:hypothetical protein
VTRALKQVSLINHESRDTEEKSGEGNSSGPPESVRFDPLICKRNDLVRNLRENNGKLKAGTPSARFEQSRQEDFWTSLHLDLAFFQRSEDLSVGVRALSVAPKESREHRQSCLAVWIQISSQKLPDNLLILAYP